MLISDSHRFLFVHVQKTGGSTIDNGLTAALGDVRRIPAANRHAPLDRLLQLEPGLADYWTAGFVRNPWARMVSWWRMMERFRDGAAEGIERYVDHLQRNRFVAGIIEKHPDFESFVMHAPDDHPRLRKPQVAFLNNEMKRADFTGRQESLEGDLQQDLRPPRAGVGRAPERQHRPGPTGLPRPLHRDDPQAGGRALRARPARVRLRVLTEPEGIRKFVRQDGLLRGLCLPHGRPGPRWQSVSACRGGPVHDLDDGGRRAGSGSRAPRPSRSRRGQQTAALFELLAAADEADRDEVRRQIVLLNTGVALALARRYHGRGIDAEDLDQAACLSLVQAVRTFDPKRGHDFMSFAVPTIVGGVKQHFRDLGWAIRVPRRVQEVQLLIDREGLPEADEIRYGVHTVIRLAKHLHLTTREVEAALRARGCFSPTSMDQEGAWPAAAGAGGVEEYATAPRSRTRSSSARCWPRSWTASPRETVSCCGCGSVRTRPSSRSPTQLRLTQAQVSRLLTRVMARLRADLEAGRACRRPRPGSKFVGSCTLTSAPAPSHGEEGEHRRLPRHRRPR